jgi:hypothetical protein
MGVKTRKLGNINDQLIQWQSIHVADGSTALTTVAGRGYFIDTTSATQTVNLPASASSSLGDTIMLKDYARKWATNAITLGSNTFDGDTNTPSFNTAGQTLTFVHMGTTKGWSLINEDTTSGLGAEYVAATGGTVATSGNFKIHTFTGDGNFVVSCAGNSAGSTTVDYLVVAGGGGGGSRFGGGGGGGGFRESSGAASGCYTISPLGACVSALPVSASTYPITVGGGGGAAVWPAPYGPTINGGKGSNSVFSTITSTGGGGGSSFHCGPTGPTCGPGEPGGSGGGGGTSGVGNDLAGGSGNTPPVSPPQGSNGGSGNRCQSTHTHGGGGGGSTAVGQDAGTSGQGGPSYGSGGAGATTVISGSSTAYAGGGGGGLNTTPSRPVGGTGGGGRGGSPDSPSNGVAGTANTGGGGGGSGGPDGAPSGAGGKGIVVIRYKFQ